MTDSVNSCVKPSDNFYTNGWIENLFFIIFFVCDTFVNDMYKHAWYLCFDVDTVVNQIK